MVVSLFVAVCFDSCYLLIVFLHVTLIGWLTYLFGFVIYVLTLVFCVV